MNILKICFFLCPLATWRRMCYDSRNAFCRFLSPHNAKVSRNGPQGVLPTIDATYSSTNVIFFGFFDVLWRFLKYLMASSAGTYDNGAIITRTGNLHPFSIIGENVRSIDCQMCSQGRLISVRGQNILCWKIGRGCHFDNNGPIYIF